jgi:PAS domain S-box-containing protein
MARTFELQKTNKLLQQEISDRKQAEESLRGREQLLANVFETMQEGVLVLDTNFKYTYWNKSMEETSHCRREEVLGRVAWEKFPFLKGNIEEAMKNAMKGEITLKRELNYTVPDGKEGWTQESYLPLRAANTSIVGVVGVIEDITERKQAQETLQLSEAKFRGLVETSSDWIWEVNQDGIYTYASPQIEAMLGYTPEEVVGKSPFDLMPSEEANRISDQFKVLIKEGRPIITVENIYLHKDGRRVVFETNGVPVFDASGNVTGYRGVDRDITDRKRVEDKMARRANLP